MPCRATALIAVLAIAQPYAAAPDDIAPPPVPASLEVPAGHQPFLIGHAEGTQAYICLPSPSGVAWTFLRPRSSTA